MATTITATADGMTGVAGSLSEPASSSSSLFSCPARKLETSRHLHPDSGTHARARSHLVVARAHAPIVIVTPADLSRRCLARRRRRRGAQPVYGTGWMAPTNGKYGVNQQQHEMNTYQQGYQPNQYQGQQGGYDYSQQQPQGGYYNSPPAYGQGQQNTGTTFNPNDGYYGQQQYGVQQPANSYQRDGNFSPPAGPPPGK